MQSHGVHGSDETHRHHELDHDDSRSHTAPGTYSHPHLGLAPPRAIASLLHSHHHPSIDSDTTLGTSERGIRALQISLLGLGATALFQVVVVLMSGSASLLADTLHNFADGLTALPLWVAFSLARRAATRRFTYGYGRAEDIAGVLIVATIFVSALVAGWESIQKLIIPQPLANVGWVIAASVVGFLGNEAVALFRLRVGREIGSAALVADGQHSRIDGLTSLAVLLGAFGSLIGFPLVDPIVGLAITGIILFIVKDSVVTILDRLMDAVDPELVEDIEHAASRIPGVEDVHAVRARWVGHQLEAELHVRVDEDLPTHASHAIVEEVRHALLHAPWPLVSVQVHADPCGHHGVDPHQLTEHHNPGASGA